jgi:hypothetical protein
VKKVSFADQFIVYCCRWMRKGLKTSAPFLGKLQQYLDAWATASQNIVIKPRLHDDDAWRAYLQWYTARTQTRMTYVPRTLASTSCERRRTPTDGISTTTS